MTIWQRGRQKKNVVAKRWAVLFFILEILGCGDFQFEIGLQVQWQNQNQNQSPTIRLTILWSKDIWQDRQKECGVKRWVKKLPWKFFDSWNMGLRFPIWDWVAGAMTKCIVPAWLYCAPHVSGSYSCYIVYAFSAVTLFDNKFTLPASCKLKVGTMAQCGLSNYYSRSLVLWKGTCTSKAHKPVTLSWNLTFTKV